MIFVVCNLVKLVDVFVPQVTNLENMKKITWPSEHYPNT